LIPKLKLPKRGRTADASADGREETPLPTPAKDSQPGEQDRPPHLDDDLRKPVSGRDHTRGDASASVTLVIYADFECGHSTDAAAAIAELQESSEAPIRVAFRHLPNPTAHRGSVAAALAAEAAGDQGCFWEMHDLLFAAEESLDLEGLSELARRLDLDVDRFRTAVSDEVFAERLENDVDSAMRSNVDGTPAIFVNGARHRGSNELEALREAVERAAAR
jgi:NhaA family Na+:H+ antiporter